MRSAPAALLAGLLTTALASAALGGPRVVNGFELEPASVPVNEILRGGPPRDGIPALTRPPVLAADESPWHDDEMVMGVELGGEARAYPIALLNWHELVNDLVGGEPILVSYCPLCGSGLVFERRVGGELRTFGVSGLLYQSDVLLYDRETESLWSQLASRAVTGPADGTRLRVLRSQQVRWGDWKERHPHTSVLSPDTGYRRDYARSPYSGYASSRELYFPAPVDRRYHPKMPTLGVRLAGGPALGFPSAEIEKSGGSVTESFEGHEIVVSFDPEAGVFHTEAPPEVEVIEAYWFAWAAFHPEAAVYVGQEIQEHP